MYLQQDRQPVYKLKYFTPDSESSGKKEFLKHVPNDDNEQPSKPTGDRDSVKSFLEPGDETFATIRKRLSTLTLTSGYNKGLEPYISPPVFRERRLPPRRISSISSRDTTERGQEGRAKVNSRASFLSDDKEFRRTKFKTKVKKERASETGAVYKLTGHAITAGENPELFARQLQLNGKSGKNIVSRSTSPKSVRSIDSSGKVHLGLIESLDLNEKLKDVEQIKERYSSDHFMNSLVLYKLKGHDRCFYPDAAQSGHIPRGTRLMDSPRSDSKLSMDSAASKLTSSNASFKYYINNNKWEPDRSHINSQIQVQPRGIYPNERKLSKRKKCVEFNMTPRELNDDDLTDLRPSTRDTTDTKRPRSILKRTHSESTTLAATRGSPCDFGPGEDEFLANSSYRWRFHLPKINSPNTSLRARPPLSFKKKMYHYGDGISSEFEQVVAQYGNCRQNSMVKDRSFVRENSHTS